MQHRKRELGNKGRRVEQKERERGRQMVGTEVGVQ